MTNIGAEQIRSLVVERAQERLDLNDMAVTVAALQRLIGSERCSAQKLASVISSDESLVHDVLKVCNNSSYSAEAEDITRAIVLLSRRSIWAIATMMKLVGLRPCKVGGPSRKRSEVPALQRAERAFISALYSAFFSRNLALAMGRQDADDALVAGAFKAFGHMVVTLCIPEQLDEIEILLERRKMKVKTARWAVLGSSNYELGLLAARTLLLPDFLIRHIGQEMPPAVEGAPTTEELLGGIAELANAAAQAMIEDADPAAPERIGAHFRRFCERYGEVDTELGELIHAPLKETLEILDGLGFVSDRHALEAKALKRVIEPSRSAPVEAEGEGQIDRTFVRGLQRTARALRAQLSLNELILEILEAMYEGLRPHDASKVVFFFRTRTDRFEYRAGIGEDLEVIKSRAEIRPQNGRDFFGVAINSGEDLVIENTADPIHIGQMPLWIKHLSRQGDYLLFLPLITRGQTIGIFYVEGRGHRVLPSKFINYLKLLRDQVAHTIVGASITPAHLEKLASAQ